MRKLTVAISQLILFATLAMGCGGPAEYVLVGTARSAGTDGMLVVETIEGGNRLISITLEHLPPPDRLGEGLNTYVMWVKRKDAAPQMASVLGYDADERSASARATTPAGEFEVLVTAEANKTATSPNDVVVVKQSVGGKS